MESRGEASVEPITLNLPREYSGKQDMTACLETRRFYLPETFPNRTAEGCRNFRLVREHAI